MKPKAYSKQAQQVKVSADREGQRLDNFLARYLRDLPKNALYRLIRTGQVRVNGGRARPDRKLNTDDVVRIPPVVTRDRDETKVSDAVCKQISDAIVYEDDDVLVVDKPSGMAVDAGSGLPWGLIDAVRQIRPGKSIELVHRIDRETSGCLLLACNGAALRHLGEQFRLGAVRKSYLCLMSGQLKQAMVTVDAPIAANRDSGEKQMEVDDSGKRAVTRFSVIEQYPMACYAQAEIETGRTHQIRVHVQFLDAPLAGDKKYSSAKQQRFWRKLGLRRLFLHASEVEFIAPTGESMVLSAPLPDALRRCLDTLAGDR